MTLLEQMTATALSANPDYTTLRPVVEKEILHHDILRIMNKVGFLKQLTFMGGTCLRCCYGSGRLSEDLDFTGGFDFTKETLMGMSEEIKAALEKKYALPVLVAEPKQEMGNTRTWKVRLTTHPEDLHLPAQHIHIDVCMLPSYEKKAVVLKNYYGLELGTSGLILYAESLDEILVDKLIAFAFRIGRVKNRDLWDIFWLNNRNVKLNEGLLSRKLADRGISEKESFIEKYRARIADIGPGQNGFITEMRRFLAPKTFSDDFTSPMWWEALLNVLKDYSTEGLN
jgi:predicted nucleotidyltransferase component of viral defense system